jgi:bla regulator protein BlaR1
MHWKEVTAMNFIHELLSERILQSLGWTFIHSLWHGAVIALILGFMLPGLRKQAANIRYALAVGSLAALLILSVTTFIRYYTHLPVIGNSEVAVAVPAHAETLVFGGALDAAPVDNLSADSGIAGLIKGFTGYFTHHFPIVVSLWFLGMILFLAKLLGGLIYSERIRIVGIKPFPESWSRNIMELKAKMKINRPVRLVVSCLARVPMVIGYIKPVVLIPLGALSGIPRDQMEAIIAHELAHIRRNDFLVNLFQSIIEAIFFYHPAVWWISGIIRKEREHCCDDLAVSVCDESVVYAKALANLQERSYETPLFAVALGKRRHSLLSRIKRLTRKPGPSINPAEKWITLGVMILIIASLSVSLKVTGSNEASAAVNPVQEMTFGFDIIHADNLPESPQPALQDTLKKSRTSTVKTRFFDASDQKEKEVKMVLEGDSVKELYVDGEKVPEDELGQYQELIDNTLAELKEAEIELEKAEVELKEAERALEEVDFERIHQELELAKEDVERAMQEMKEIDRDRISLEIEHAKEEFRKAIEQIEKIDMEEIRSQYREMERDFEQIWQDFDTTEFNRELQRSLEEIKRNFREFDQDYMREVREEMEEAKRAIRESMGELNRLLEREMEEFSESREMERERRTLDEEWRYREQELQMRQEAREREMEARERNREAEVREFEARRRETEARQREMEAERRIREAKIMEKESAMDAIEKQLLADGFYSEGDVIDFELSADKLLINGKKQPRKVFEKYKKIYEEWQGSIPQTATITIKK